MGLSEALGRIAVRHAHVLVAEVPGHWVTRAAVERHVLSRGWRLAVSPADADILAVCGPPPPHLEEPLHRLWGQLPGPRSRIQVESPQAAVPALLAAEEDLLDLTRQRADSRDRSPDRAATGHAHPGEHHAHERHAPHDHPGHDAAHPGPERRGGGGQHGGTAHQPQADHGTGANSVEVQEGTHRGGRTHDAHGHVGHVGHREPPHGGAEHTDDGGRGHGDDGHTGHGDHDPAAAGRQTGDGGAEHAGHEDMPSAGHGAMDHSGHAPRAGPDHADHEGMGHTAHGAMMHAGHAGMGHAGMAHGGMDMAPGGIPLAPGGEDRDGLEMDLLHLRLGPVLAYWPAGLVLRCTLQGDVIVDAEASLVAAADPAADAEPRHAPEDPRRFAARRCDNAASLLGLAGWADAASGARRIRDALLFTEDRDGPAGELHRLRRMVGRSWWLRWSLRRVGPLDAHQLAHRGLPEPMTGDVRDRLLAMLDRAAHSIAGRHPTGPPLGVPVDAIPDLVRGWDLATARLIVASLDLDPLAMDREVSDV
ncbi:hypothetical protein [Micromonospora sp. NPDC005806]|uniref:hypothetical protein n=1 Tax=Micromonospora sp. NPDC005806 TaxID=3364234 RepID=UPI0036CB2986